jgi:hypothetical protein
MPRFNNHEWKSCNLVALRCKHCKTLRRTVLAPALRVAEQGGAKMVLYKHYGRGKVWTTERPKCKDAKEYSQ